ncbi:MFS transporter [Alicyclobacillus cellulosilyticus]|uniref:MFS transporter n=1 Tax=Alicyclobacillus cellulosilyticus TaxID=1003997 RepID=A0A917KD63_9BACL|nr:MFS transporter [Alicyclobacillus cellulosilyticus]GGJ07586.1 MFS transporter [Alicyclobacillus cellulosilyticus]
MENEEILTRLGMQMRPETWANFRWDLTSAMFISLFSAVFGQFYTPMALRHGASNFQVGLLTAAPAIGLLFSPLWANLLQGRRLKPFVVWPNLFARLSLAVVAVWSTPWVFVAIALFINFLGGVQAPAYAALVTRMYPPQLRGRLMGYVRVAMGSCLLPVTFGLGIWLQSAGDAGPLWAAAAAGVTSILVFSQVREVEPVAADHTRAVVRLRDQWQVLRGNRALGVFLAATTLSGFANLLANPLYQIYQVHTLGLTDTQISWTRIMYYACLLVAYLLMGWVIDRWSPRAAMFVGIGAYLSVPLFYALWGTYPAVILGSGCQGIGDATWDIGCLSYVFRAAPGQEAVAFGLHLMLFGVRGTLAPLVSTSLSHAVPDTWIFFFSSFLGLLGAITLAVFGRPRPERTSAVRKWIPVSHRHV